MATILFAAVLIISVILALSNWVLRGILFLLMCFSVTACFDCLEGKLEMPAAHWAILAFFCFVAIIVNLKSYQKNGVDFRSFKLMPGFFMLSLGIALMCWFNPYISYSYLISLAIILPSIISFLWMISEISDARTGKQLVWYRTIFLDPV